MSEILVGAAAGTGQALGMSETFIGLIFLAIVGGAAETGSAPEVFETLIAPSGLTGIHAQGKNPP